MTRKSNESCMWNVNSWPNNQWNQLFSIVKIEKMSEPTSAPVEPQPTVLSTCTDGIDECPSTIIIHFAQHNNHGDVQIVNLDILWNLINIHVFRNCTDLERCQSCSDWQGCITSQFQYTWYWNQECGIGMWANFFRPLFVVVLA